MEQSCRNNWVVHKGKVYTINFKRRSTLGDRCLVMLLRRNSTNFVGPQWISQDIARAYGRDKSSFYKTIQKTLKNNPFVISEKGVLIGGPGGPGGTRDALFFKVLKKRAAIEYLLKKKILQ